MVLKRKRSESEFSSSSSLFSSPQSGALHASLHNEYTVTPVPTPLQLSSRTRKRYRNNRPSESEVHQHTLSMLYGAHHNQEPQPILSHPELEQTLRSAPTQPVQKSNLHAFWSLPQPPRAAVSQLPSLTTITLPTACEDCHACLSGVDDTDATDVDMMAMDVDERDFGCTSCGKQVCHSCAVSILGAERKCLGCTKPRAVSRGLFGWGFKSDS